MDENKVATKEDLKQLPHSGHQTQTVQVISLMDYQVWSTMQIYQNRIKNNELSMCILAAWDGLNQCANVLSMLLSGSGAIISR